jgi:chromosome segregation ATPase
MLKVDAALDSVNVSKVANFIRSRSKHCQFIVISLKDDFFKRVCADFDVLSNVPF